MRFINVNELVRGTAHEGKNLDLHAGLTTEPTLLTALWVLNFLSRSPSTPLLPDRKLVKRCERWEALVRFVKQTHPPGSSVEDEGCGGAVRLEAEKLVKKPVQPL